MDETKLEASNNNLKEYKVETIWNNVVYTKESKSCYLPGLYYLVFWKSYLKEENTWKPALVIQNFRKLSSLFHKNYLDKLIVTFPTIDITLLMARLTVKPIKPFK